MCNRHKSYNNMIVARNPVSRQLARRPYASSFHLPVHVTLRMGRPCSSRQPREQEDEPYIQLEASELPDDGDMWKSKPPWCQPSTILLTGATVITMSWLLFNSFVVTTLISALVCAWWFLFLVLVPTAYKKQRFSR